MKTRFLQIGLLIAFFFLLSTYAEAKTTTWNVTIGGAWTAAGNWDNGIPVAGDDVIINSDQSAAITAVPAISLNSLTVSGNCSLSGSAAITITVTGTFYVSASKTLTVGNGTNPNRINITLSSLCIGTIEGTVTLNTAGTNEIFTNLGNLTIAPAGLIDDITNAADFVLSSGAILQIGSTSGISSTGASGNVQMSGNNTFNSGANYVYNGTAAQITGTGLTQNTPANLTIDNSAGVTLTAATTISGLLTMTSGTLNMANTNMTVGSLTGSSNLTHSSGIAGNRTLTIGSDGTSPSAYNGVISNGTATSVIITKNGTGTLILSGDNSYTGLTTISAGTLKLGATGSGSNSPLGTVVGATSVTSGAALDLNGFTLATAEPLTLNGTGISSGGALTNSSVTDASYSGLITLGSTGVSIVNNGGDINITHTGTITGAGFALTLGGSGNGNVTSIIGTTTGTLTKSGTGIWTLSGANTYTGLTTISGGTLQYGTNNVLSNGAVTVNGGIYDIVSYNDAVGTVTLINGTIAGTSGILTGTSYAVQNGSISAILAGAVALTKTTTGTVTISGTNTYTGVTTINAGILSAGTIGNGGVAGNLGAASNAAANLVLGGGTLEYTGITASTDRNYTLTSGTTSIIDITISGTTLTISGASTITTGALTKTGPGTLKFSGANLYTGLTSVLEGTLQYGIANALSNGAVTVNGGTYDIVSYNDAVGTVTLINGSIAGTSGILTGTSYAMQSGSVSAILAGAVALTKTTSGTVTMSGVSTYTGVTTISAGILSVGTIGDGGVAGNLGAASNAAANLVLGGGTLQYTGASASTNRNYILSAGTTSTIDLTTNNLTISGASTNTTGALTKIGTGTLTLSGNNLYTGATTINEGTLKLGASERIANTSDLTVNGTFDLAGFSETVAALSGTGTITSSASGNLTLTAGDATNTTFSGVIENGSATSVALTKSGNGTLILSGANSFTGTTTITAGTLMLGASGVLADGSSVTLNGGTLSTGSGAGFSETIGALNLKCNSIISLGTGVHTLTIANSSAVTWGGTN